MTGGEQQHGVRVLVKVVPGARKDEIAGMLGERLKVRVAAPPEDGKANEAVCRVIASALGLRARQVTIESGRTNPEKCVRIDGLAADEVRARLGLA